MPLVSLCRHLSIHSYHFPTNPRTLCSISCVRLYLVVRGQWETDQSWWYDPMLAVENAEIGGTLIALSVPGLKPLFEKWLTRIDGSISRTKSGSGPTSSGQESKPRIDQIPVTPSSVYSVPYRNSTSEGPISVSYSTVKESSDSLLESGRLEPLGPKLPDQSKRGITVTTTISSSIPMRLLSRRT